MEMYREMTTKILCQFLIGNVYLMRQNSLTIKHQCQFLIGNVYLEQQEYSSGRTESWEGVNSL